ncbi:MAG: hypothetical protein Unbinned1524contig1003_32 [Prokaryotic dsDNA virus sp.]|nr:MAG: hypothetical protein Unbinned1524contig1003_32 [Prokaryotic dsDNA virus sp.]|tara:strand:- start:6875 stop:7366 length:492 start_codon:yes stop_codon:yes gene_type:complete
MTEEQLQALILYDIAVWESYLPYLAAQIKQEIAFGVFAGLSEEEVLANITTKALTGDQLETVIATALANYSRSVTYGVMQQEPDDTLYAYIGPIDGRTRNECLKMGSEQPLTQKEIINNYGNGVLLTGGGYNCRHKWQSIGKRVKYAKRFYNPNKAGELLEDD